MAQEEFFGPVALVFTVKNLDEAIALANNIPFGLGASAWTENSSESKRLVAEIEAGGSIYQRHGQIRSAPAFWWYQAFWLRTRTEQSGDSRICQSQNCLD